MSKKRKKINGFLPSIVVQANGRKRGLAGTGDGAHQEVSPMARATVTPNKREKQRRKDRQKKQQGWA
jgi:hypothetical protein